jgi:hypothetical protein
LSIFYLTLGLTLDGAPAALAADSSESQLANELKKPSRIAFRKSISKLYEMMKTFPSVVIVIASALLTTSFKMGGHGENQPTVQSTADGHAYVRSIPSGDYGDEGKTQVFRVRKNGDELLDEYPLYMRGEFYLGGSPITGKSCLVHLEPERLTSNDDFKKLGKISRLAFYMGGKELLAYTGEDLEKMGLKDRVQTLGYRHAGQFMVLGIQQVPLTNHYVFVIEKIGDREKGTETTRFDITTGKPFGNDSQRTPEPQSGANSPADSRH